MKLHALAVDDDPAILEDVKDRLLSLGHSCDGANSQEAARQLLLKNQYSYVLADLEIPVQYGKPSRVQNGQNLVRQIRGIKGYEHIPIIAMTAHGHDSPELAIDVLRCNGATDYVQKPFPTKGRTLEKAIQEALHAAGRLRPGAAPRLGPHPQEPPQPFEHGDMVFFGDRVELCDVKLCGDAQSGMIRKILDILRQKTARGVFTAHSGEDLAKLVGCSAGQNGIAGAVRDFRKKAAELLREEANIICGSQDIIASGGRGYRLSDKIAMRDGSDPKHEPVDEPVSEPDDPENGPVSTGGEPELNERQRWFLAQLRSGKQPRIGDLVAKFSCSKTTAKRDLADLRRRELIEFDGPPKTGRWRLHRSPMQNVA